VEGTIEWTEEPDFGYEVAAAIPGVDGIEIPLAAAALRQAGRTGGHDTIVARLKREREELLNSSPASTNLSSSRLGDGAGSHAEPQSLTRAFHSLGTFAVDHHGDEGGLQHGTS